MCGIAGRFNPGALSADRVWCERAQGLLAHRGPDASGNYVDSHCQLVNCRLAIVDPTPTGDQPATNEAGNIRVIHNGEIYNHAELRRDLQKRGHTFRGTCDTEVLVHLYEEYGTEMVARLCGMFAFAVYDEFNRRLLLARDRFGIKPLYYATTEGGVIFASEIKAILGYSGISPELDGQACYDYFGLGYIPEPLTGYRNISLLPKATVLVIDPNGHRLTRYHTIRCSPRPDQRLPEAVFAASDRLLQSVARQSIADVRVGAFLSGGLDSSLVVAACSRVGTQPPTTFNVRFPDRDYDETEIARSVSRHCRTDHVTVSLEDWKLTPELISRLLLHFDQPFADTSLIPTYLVSRAAREHGIKCALSGDGGDEVFGGYARFWRANTLLKLMAAPAWLEGMITWGGGLIASFTRDFGRQVRRAAELVQGGRRQPAFLIAGLANYLDEKEKENLVLGFRRGGLQAVYRHFNGSHSGPLRLERLSTELTENLFEVGLPADMLRKVDMMSMLAGLEVRVPMLDEQVVALGLTLPHQLKTDGKKGKLVLRGLANDWLPQEVANHPKHGFAVPLDVMMTPDVYVMLEDMLLSPGARTREFLNQSVIGNWLTLFRRSRRGHSGGRISRGGLYQRIFIVLSLELWLRQHRLSW